MNQAYDTLILCSPGDDLAKLNSAQLAALDLYYSLYEDDGLADLARQQALVKARRLWTSRAARAVTIDGEALQASPAVEQHHLTDLAFGSEMPALTTLSSAQLLALKYTVAGQADEALREDAIEELQKRRQKAHLDARTNKVPAHSALATPSAIHVQAAVVTDGVTQAVNTYIEPQARKSALPPDLTVSPISLPSLDQTQRTYDEPTIVQQLRDVIRSEMSSQLTVIVQGMIRAAQRHLLAKLLCSTANRRLATVTEALLVHTVRPSSDKTERGDNRPFKLACYNYFYRCDNPVDSYPKELRCMLTGIAMPSSAVVASHLLAHKFKHLAHIFDLANIDDPCNGLLLYKGVEEAFDRNHICFVYDSATGHFLCQVLDKTLSRLPWSQYMRRNSSKAKPEGTDIITV